MGKILRRLSGLLAVMICLAIAGAGGEEAQNEAAEPVQAGHALAPVHLNEEKPADWETRERLKITALGFYQNDVFILECGGETMLLDGGAVNYWRNYMNWLEEKGLSHVNILFNSHPHDDHIEAVYYMVNSGRLTADRFISPFPEGYRDADGLQRKMAALLKKKGIPFEQILTGEELTLGGARMRIYRWDGGDTNARSGGFRLQFGKATMLFTADWNGETERWVLAEYGAEALKADILKAPHHGIVQLVPEFLEAVDPALVIVTSNGKTNVKKQLDHRGYANIWTSIANVELETDGEEWYVTQGEKWMAK